MGCFPACFGHWSHKETMKNVPDQCLSPSHEAAKLLPATNESLKEEEIVSTKKLESESEDKCEEQTNKNAAEKAVSYDSNNKKCTDELTNNDGDDSLVEKEMEKDEDDALELKMSNSGNFKIRDFLISDKDCAAVKPKEVTLEHCPVQQESSGSLFSLSIDSRKHVFAAETGDKEVTSAFKTKSKQLKHDEGKENVTLSKSFNEAKPTNDHHLVKKRGSGIAVETSLSSWLVESEKSPKDTSTGNSPESEKNYGGREILGAITSHVELKELNGISSGASTPCCSADDQLGIGTVGRYWRQRGQPGELPSSGPVSDSSCRSASSVCTEV